MGAGGPCSGGRAGDRQIGWGIRLRDAMADCRRSGLVSLAAWNPRHGGEDGCRAGLNDLRTARCRMECRDIGAVVDILRKCVWWVPDFTVDRYRTRWPGSTRACAPMDLCGPLHPPPRRGPPSATMTAQLPYYRPIVETTQWERLCQHHQRARSGPCGVRIVTSPSCGTARSPA
jgi:hypothetical protein